MKLKSYISIIACSLFSLIAEAGDTLHMHSIEIAGSTWNQQKVVSDSLQNIAFKLQSITSVLQQLSSVNIRSYGPSMLSSISVRGANANQTMLQWRGFNTNNAMLGQSDLSLIPMAFFENSQLNYGASKVKHAQAIAGSLDLQERMDTTRRVFECATSINGLKNQSAYLSYSQHQSKNTAHLKLFESTGSNEFRYYNSFKKNQINNTGPNPIRVFSVLFGDSYALNQHLRFDASAWYSHANRVIPSTTVEAPRKSMQVDDDLKLTSALIYQRQANELQVAYLYNPSRMDYTDSNLVSSNRINQHQFRLSHDVKKSTWLLQSNYHVNYAQGRSSNYVGSQQHQVVHKLSTGLTKTFSKQRYLSLAAALNTLNSRIYYPSFTSRLSKRGSLCKPFDYVVHTEFYRAVRFPTLNDLYWNPGGNTRLLPELSNNADVGVSVESKQLNIAFQVFRKEIQQMIVWTPQGSYWSPMNVLAVRAEGFDASAAYSFHVSQIKFLLKLDYTYTSSTIKEENSNHSLVGNQLPYIPYHKANSSVAIYRGKTFVNVQSTYVGYRFTSNDNKAYLNPFVICNMQVGHGFTIQKKPIQLVLNVYNLLNTHYETIAYRPMPLRYVELCLQFKLDKI